MKHIRWIPDNALFASGYKVDDRLDIYYGYSHIEPHGHTWITPTEIGNRPISGATTFPSGGMMYLSGKLSGSTIEMPICLI